jgi:hypothetical protein
MATIMCSQRMWRLVRLWERPASSDGGRDVPILGPWAATVRRDGSDLVLAVDARTYLTTVFPFTTATAFHADCARALGAILEDLEVPPERIALETDVIASAPLVPLSDEGLRDALGTVEFVCGIELEYHSDLRRVQANLSEFPHAPAPYYVPIVAARSAFGLPSRDPLERYR